MTTVRKIAQYGWKPDSPDHRDQFLPTMVARVPLPTSADLRTTGCLPPVYNQGQLGSCTANAIAAAVDFERKRQGEEFIGPSRLMIYYNERAVEGSVSKDSGAQIRDGIKSVASQGVCPESEWPYSDEGDLFTKKPSDSCYADALKFKTTQYSRVTQADYFIKHCVAILGRPIVFGIAVFPSFESDEAVVTGDIPMPGPKEAPIGGHAILLVGFDSVSKKYIFRNSWGTGFGQEGYGRLDAAYVENPNLASDFWVVQLES